MFALHCHLPCHAIVFLSTHPQKIVWANELVAGLRKIYIKACCMHDGYSSPLCLRLCGGSCSHFAGNVLSDLNGDGEGILLSNYTILVLMPNIYSLILTELAGQGTFFCLDIVLQSAVQTLKPCSAWYTRIFLVNSAQVCYCKQCSWCHQSALHSSTPPLLSPSTNNTVTNAMVSSSKCHYSTEELLEHKKKIPSLKLSSGKPDNL